MRKDIFGRPVQVNVPAVQLTVSWSDWGNGVKLLLLEQREPYKLIGWWQEGHTSFIHRGEYK